MYNLDGHNGGLITTLLEGLSDHHVPFRNKQWQVANNYNYQEHYLRLADQIQGPAGSKPRLPESTGCSQKVHRLLKKEGMQICRHVDKPLTLTLRDMQTDFPRPRLSGRARRASRSRQSLDSESRPRELDLGEMSIILCSLQEQPQKNNNGGASVVDRSAIVQDLIMDRNTM
ncbi:uncharacterized protein BDV14DRAFT_174405, partial [Aspergillus stella-maris]|uniref:uncharacterized protein n=1 Tax=Aspergillus stella-maris TaxID=1810926 RepID=UPI003CCCD10C